MKTKICSKCKIDKNISNFGKSKQSKDGFKFHCYDCRNNQYKNRIKPGHPNFIGPIIPENIRLCHKCSTYKTLNEVVRGQNKNKEMTYHNICKVCRLNYCSILRQNNPERYKEAMKKYRSSLKARETKKKYKQQLKVRIHEKIRDEIKRMVKKRGMVKSDSTNRYLGCDDETFIKYIECQFESWMNWNNYGPGYAIDQKGKPIYLNGETILLLQWNFDHIIPCENFDLENCPEQVFICFNYKNYRPILAQENSRKSDLLPDGTRARHNKQPELNNFPIHTQF